MPYDFDRVIDRRATHSIKWKLYGPDVLPLWVADMDFPAPEPVLAALRRAVRHGVFGYEFPTRELREIVAARMDKLYGWKVSPEMVVATPGVIAGFTAAAGAVCAAGEGILIQPPVYPPFLGVHAKAGLARQFAPLECSAYSQELRYSVDWEAFARGLNSEGAHTGMFLLCSPHNPTGRAFSRADLQRMAELCLKNGTAICSDEIHAELLLGGAEHVPVASLAPEIAARTVTLIAPSKTFNVAGLHCGFAIVAEKELRGRFKNTVERMAMHVNSLGLVAAQAAFSGQCDGWLADLRAYLTANRDFLAGFVRRELNGIRITVPEATYLAWLDCRELNLLPSPHKFFLEQAKVALNEGAEFGPGGEGFVRLNFGCPRRTLEEALERMKRALLTCAR
ncbi:MAG: cystathione beta-lyase [Anaerolineaceae bacterium]|nr:MAG: cystathione beta-lyase [Anaerolineaceae bacterium]